MKKKIILIGGGGHCNACIDVIEAQNKYTIIGIIEKNEKEDYFKKDYPIIGYDKDLANIIKKNKLFFISIGYIKNPKIRNSYYKTLKDKNLTLPIIISPKSYVSKNAIIGEGTIIMHFASININTKVGTNCIINTQSFIEHDSEIGNNCHISTGAKINGSVKIGNDVFVGSGAIIYQGVRIKSSTIIPAGEIIKKDIL